MLAPISSRCPFPLLPDNLLRPSSGDALCPTLSSLPLLHRRWTMPVGAALGAAVPRRATGRIASTSRRRRSSTGSGSSSWRINKDGYPTKGDPPTAEELCTHRGGRYNARGHHVFWDGKSYYAVVAQLRPRRWAAAPSPRRRSRRFRGGRPAAGAGCPPGLLVALRASMAAAAAATAAEVAREEAEIAAAIQVAHAMGATDQQPVASDDDADADWDGLAVSSDNDDGLDGGGAGVGEDIVYVDESD
ncbi:hypothetical protein ZWY2020_016689 [Hordeum vulgare]|nr:hypothetical protein ZWY2020_016689 [Hordeum vulgare]